MEVLNSPSFFSGVFNKFSWSRVLIWKQIPVLFHELAKNAFTEAQSGHWNIVQVQEIKYTPIVRLLVESYLLPLFFFHIKMALAVNLNFKKGKEIAHLLLSCISYWFIYGFIYFFFYLISLMEFLQWLYSCVIYNTSNKSNQSVKA